MIDLFANTRLGKSAFALLAGVLTASSAMAGGPQKLSGDITVFRCNFAGEKFDRETATVPTPFDGEPDLIVSIPSEMLKGQADLLSKRSDFRSFKDRKKVFRKMKKFELEGRWPGAFSITGYGKNGQRASFAVVRADGIGPQQRTIAKLVLSASIHDGVCSTMQLTPSGISL
ncbi:hypothetical protein [Sphingomicrobium flavum]|uniref:hypothetical protein n=1 Tax=Sphingomicrobium flavum TaxID=1229164 RepID=UPI0021ADC683|nr:hypothetical protein [Sphingomicrobium flavum]